MKKENLLHSLICLLAVSCTVQEIDTQLPVKENPVKQDVFYASLESYSTPETKVYVDEYIDLHWDAEDKLSIFNQNTLNHPYQFAGETGDVAGYFTSVSNPAGEGNDLDFIYAVYPYRESTTINDEGVISLYLPEIQTYKEGSFGLDANTMVSRTDGNFLNFKNACGYLVLKFYGSGSIKSIKLEGKNGEKLSGEATVTHSTEGNPEIAMTSNAGTSITLNCETPVELGSTPTVFWMVVPPTSFTDGFMLTVTDPNGYVFFKETSRTDLSIGRNSVLRIASIAVSFNTSGISLNDDDDNNVNNDFISPVNPENQTINYKTTVKEENRTVTVTMPTVTNFKSLKFNFRANGKTIYADGKKIVSGETPIDASKDVILTIRDGQYGKNYTLKARNTGLPVVRITTPCSQDEINKDDWVAGASIRIDNADGTIDLDVSTEIKGRGNATWNYNKKPYALRLASKEKVLGMKKHKRWILLANWKDRTLLRNDAAFWLSQQVSDVIQSPSFPYTVHGQFVELEFNGVHRGNYYLCEQIKIDKNRLNINEFEASDISGGYLMEIDNNYDENYKFLSEFYGVTRYGRFTPYGLKYMFNDPDENLPDDAFNFMKGYIQDMEALIKGIRNNSNYNYGNNTDKDYGYRGYLDMDSAIWFMFVNELTGNGDFFNTDGGVTTEYYGPHSTYLYKDRDIQNDDGTITRSKLHMGPVWDFDYKTFISKLNNEQRSKMWVGANQQNYYYYYLCKDPMFRERMLYLWEEYREIITPKAFTNHIDSMADYIRLSELFNTRMWGYSNTSQDQGQNGDNELSFQDAVDLVKKAFKEKRVFMDDYLETLNQ